MQDAPAIAWRWSAALPGALFAIPAAIVTLRDPSVGLALAYAAVPAAAVGITPTRRSRHVIVVVGACIGLSLVLGAALATSWLTAVPGIFVLCLGAAVLSDRGPVGRLLMLLAVPMIGAGLSFSDVGTAAELAIVMLIGSTFCWLLALCWPSRPAPERPNQTPVSSAILVGYGVRLSAAGAITAGLGFALGLEHKGWATAAALLVMRPDRRDDAAAQRRTRPRRGGRDSPGMCGRTARGSAGRGSCLSSRRRDRSCRNAVEPLVRHRRVYDVHHDPAADLRVA